MTPEMRCPNCKFWERTRTPDLRKVQGICRRFPPVAAVMAIPVAPGVVNVTAWPETEGTHWCGEHKPTLAVEG